MRHMRHGACSANAGGVHETGETLCTVLFLADKQEQHMVHPDYQTSAILPQCQHGIDH